MWRFKPPRGRCQDSRGFLPRARWVLPACRRPPPHVPQAVRPQIGHRVVNDHRDLTNSRRSSVRWPGHRSLRVDLDEEEDLGCGRCGKPRSSRFSKVPVDALFASMGTVGVHGPGAGDRHGVRVALERTQTWGEGPVLPTGTLVTASSSDRPSRSLLLCHGSRSLSSRRPPRALRRRGPAPPTESLSSLQPSLRRLRGV